MNGLRKIFVKQIFELGEWVGFETRNKYQFTDENNNLIAYAAEQQKGILGFLFRQYLGHWRRFDIHFYNSQRQLLFIAHHPFRWFFERVEVTDADGRYVGAIQKLFSVITKKFVIENQVGHTAMKVSSPVWKIWTFPFIRHNEKVVEVRKRWSGIVSEALSDRDNFEIEFFDISINEDLRKVILASAVYIDLQYFENKQ